jgi:hypothetical protein
VRASKAATSSERAPPSRSLAHSHLCAVLHTGWLTGGNNSPSPARFTTSFDALDDLVGWIGTNFASVTQISLVGFSAGGQLISRWAFFSSLPTSYASSLLTLAAHARDDTARNASAAAKARAATVAHTRAARGAPMRRRHPRAPHGATTVRAIVSDPSSYLYLDGQRPDSSCSPLYDTGGSHTCSSFSVPADADNCSGEYDDYKYGLSDLANQTTNLYITTYYADNASTPRYGSNPARAARCCMQWLEPGSRGAMPLRPAALAA